MMLGAREMSPAAAIRAIRTRPSRPGGSPRPPIAGPGGRQGEPGRRHSGPLPRGAGLKIRAGPHWRRVRSDSCLSAGRTPGRRRVIARGQPAPAVPATTDRPILRVGHSLPVALCPDPARCNRRVHLIDHPHAVLARRGMFGVAADAGPIIPVPIAPGVGRALGPDGLARRGGVGDELYRRDDGGLSPHRRVAASRAGPIRLPLCAGRERCRAGRREGRRGGPIGAGRIGRDRHRFRVEMRGRTLHSDEG
jgi:hypothetical protein